MRKVFEIIGWIVVILVFTSLFFYNLINNDTFFSAPFTSLMTVGVALFVSYGLVQSRNNRRKKSDKLSNLLYKIQGIIRQEEFVESQSERIQRRNLIMQRSVGNKIEYLKKGCEKDTSLKKLVEQMEEEFLRFREFYGEHYKDQDYMRKSEKELMNFIVKMDDIADKIHIELL